MSPRTRTGPEQGGGETSDGDAQRGGDLAERYATMCEKYRGLVEKSERAVAEKSGATVLALAAMGASVTGLAAIQEDHCLVRNQRWDELGSREAGWREGEGPASRARTSLERLALDEAARLVESGVPRRAARWEDDAGRAVELQLERVSQSSPPVVLAMLSDVTERVRGERELARMRDAVEGQERLRAVGELASGVAHDLNNTLHAMTLRLSRLSTCVASCPEHREDLRAVERITAAARGRVRRLQELVSRRAPGPAAPVDLGAVAGAAAEVVRQSLCEAGRKIELDVRLLELPPVLADGAELDHVFLHLLANARDAIPGSGRIEVTGRVAPDGFVEVSVADEGTGVPPELLERIFEPFFSTKGRGGSGLGLSMVRSAVTRLGGTVSAENRREGGARFTVRLPAAPPAARRAPALPAPQPRPRGLEVLVVDDDHDNLEAMRLVLEGWGQRVQVTDSGRDAIGRIERGAHPDLVLCDLGLGDATGWEVARRVRAARPETRVVIVTGWAEEIARDDPRRREVMAVLPKPVEPVELREVLGRAATPRLAPGGAATSP